MNVELLELLELDDLQGEVRSWRSVLNGNFPAARWNVMAVPEKCIFHSRIR